MNPSDAVIVSYLVVVRGIQEASAYELFEKRFPGHRIGAKPGPQPREIYLIVDCELGGVSDTLSWIAETISGKYRVVEIGISIDSPYNWANLDVPPEILNVAIQYGATLRVMFSSPVVK
jgi:hypothetical protein